MRSPLQEDTNLFVNISSALKSNPNIRCVFIDEAQFLTKSQEKELA